MLYLISTPIGNLADITLRALDLLKTCDYILCEDTRHSIKLLSHYEIRKPLRSYHKFNEKSRSEEIIKDLKEGMTIALISDAGTPGISDPGEILVRRCHEENIPVTSAPGPCAAIMALTLSGFSTRPFQLIGFLPRKKGELTRTFQGLLEYEGTSICYESPHRLTKALELLASLGSERKVAVIREMTKHFEECRRGSAKELAEHFSKKPPKGEIVLLIGQ
jgi:16S rRNA (cytidine1402-2'-O)-methyltransferase